MALQKAYKMKSGLVLPRAYYKVSDVKLSYIKNRAWIKVAVFADKESRMQGYEPVKEDEYRVYDQGGEKGRNASFVIQYSLDDLEEPSFSNKINIKIKKGEELVIEGIEENSDPLSLFQSVVEKLTTNEFIQASFDIEENEDEKTLILTSKEETDQFNDFDITGADFINIQKSGGAIEVKSDFQEFFSVEAMDSSKNNVVRQSYFYLKTLDEFKDAEDVNVGE